MLGAGLSCTLSNYASHASLTCPAALLDHDDERATTIEAEAAAAEPPPSESVTVPKEDVLEPPSVAEAPITGEVVVPRVAKPETPPAPVPSPAPVPAPAAVTAAQTAKDSAVGSWIVQFCCACLS